jgi:GWxTD domain-containing protein
MGDTAEALRVLAAAREAFPRSAEAHFRRAYLLFRFGGLRASDVARRDEAGEALKQALRLDPRNPRYVVELGYHRAQSAIFRFDADRIFRRALRMAREQNDPLALADVGAALGDLSRRRAELLRTRRLAAAGQSGQFDPDQAIADWHYTAEYLADHSRPIAEMGETDSRLAEEYYRQAFTALPSHEGAALGLLTLLADEQRHEEYLAVARAFVAAAPANPRAHMALGLGLARAGRIAQAAARFDAALAMLEPAGRAAIFDLSPILRRRDANSYETLPDTERLVFDRLYWDASDPLHLTPENEYRVEYLARVAYADMRFGDRERAIRGLQTAPGAVYVRYGPPDVAAAFPPASAGAVNDPGIANRVITVWWYPQRKLRFVFRGTPGLGPMRFAGDFEQYAEEARQLAPVRWDNVPLVSRLDTVALQLARLRGPAGGTVLYVYAGLPLRRMLDSVALARASLDLGLFVTDPAGRAVVTRRGTETVPVRADQPFENRSYELPLGRGEFEVRIEAREGASERSARGVGAVRIPKGAGSGFDLSDVIVASRVEPRGEARRGLRDFFLQPNPAQSFEPGTPVHLYWEMYAPRADSAGIVRYQVSVLVRNTAIERHSLVARVVGGVGDAMGLTATGEDWVTLTYQNQTPLGGRDRVPEYLSIDLVSAPEGTYAVMLRVRDLVSGEERSEETNVRVHHEPGPAQP